MKWTEKEIEYLRKEYPDRSNADLAVFLHRSPRAVKLKALKLGITSLPSSQSINEKLDSSKRDRSR